MSDMPIVELSSDLLDTPRLENLSEITVAVLNAYMNGYGWLDGPTKKDCLGLAAALRAAAEQGENFYDPHKDKVSAVRIDKILAIAAELESTNA